MSKRENNLQILIKPVIEGWMRSDGLAHRYAVEIRRGEDVTPYAAEDLAWHIARCIERSELESVENTKPSSKKVEE